MCAELYIHEITNIRWITTSFNTSSLVKLILNSLSASDLQTAVDNAIGEAFTKWHALQKKKKTEENIPSAP